MNNGEYREGTAMDVCIMIEGQEGVSWREWQSLAVAAEDAGLTGLFRSDHYTSFHTAPGPALDAWATLAAMATSTNTLQLGTLVSPATFRHPSELARIVTTVDHVSDGRVAVGIGAGWFEQEHRQNGFEFPDLATRFDRFTEYVEVVVRSFGGEPFDFDGRHFTLESQLALPVPIQQPHPPVILGGQARSRSLALAVRFAQEYNVAFLAPTDVERVGERRDRACADAGRNPATLPLSMMTLVALGENAAAASRRLTSALERFRGSRERCHEGTVEEMAELLRRYESAGLRRVYLQHPDRDDMEAIALMGELAHRIA
jgi:F420-dependent oxidoreductase-like protein